MNPNIGSTDRTARLVVGALLALVGLAAFAGVANIGPVVGAVALVVGVVLVGTALARVCLVYRILGVDTSSR